jgi:hypothetical protein
VKVSETNPNREIIRKMSCTIPGIRDFLGIAVICRMRSQGSVKLKHKPAEVIQITQRMRVPNFILAFQTDASGLSAPSCCPWDTSAVHAVEVPYWWFVVTLAVIIAIGSARRANLKLPV